MNETDQHFGETNDEDPRELGQGGLGIWPLRSALRSPRFNHSIAKLLFLKK